MILFNTQRHTFFGKTLFWTVAFLLLSFALSRSQTSPAPTPDATALADFAMAHTGDAVRGQQIFSADPRMICTKCHSTDGHGGKAGPDLGAIGDKFSRRDLIRSVLEPSATIAVGYCTTVVTTKDGEEHSGVVKEADETTIVLLAGDGQPQRIATADIKEQHTSAISLMPEGLAGALKPQEFSDLISYLESLHQQLDTAHHSTAMPDFIAKASRGIISTPFFGTNIHLEHPDFFSEMPGFTNRWVVLQHNGKAWVITRDADGEHQTTLVDLTGEVHMSGGAGLLGLAFHPGFAKNHKYYLQYQVDRPGHVTTLLMERQFNADFTTDSGAAPRMLMEIPGSTQDHHGGTIEFGSDGYLYFGMGDTGPQRDPQGHGQDLSVLLGKMLRLDVDHSSGDKPYAIPRDNPFLANPNARPEIWAYGFREPWRFTFDSLTHDLWLGDVGQDAFEEVTMPRVGENHGWNVYEGVTPFSNQYRREGEKYISPVFAYPHRFGVSITGGYVYRGHQAPALYGHYICGDFQMRRIWALTQTNRTLQNIVEIGESPSRISSFAQDHDGELYSVGYDTGLIYKLDLSKVLPAPREARVIAATSEQSPVLWRFSLQSPASGWERAGFDDASWKISPGGFGTAGTPGAIVRTDWHTDDIWLRREFTIATNDAAKHGTLILRLHHDEDVEVYLNGVQIAHEPNYISGYMEFPLAQSALDALRTGRNLLAIHCHQTTGGQYVDAGLVEYAASGE